MREKHRDREADRYTWRKGYEYDQRDLSHTLLHLPLKKQKTWLTIFLFGVMLTSILRVFVNNLVKYNKVFIGKEKKIN